MKTIKLLLLSAAYAAVVLTFSAFSVLADEIEEATAGGEATISEALAQLDVLLTTQGNAADALPVASPDMSPEVSPDMSAVMTVMNARLKNLTDENQILKDEIGAQNRRMEQAEENSKRAQANLERLIKDGGAADNTDEQNALLAAEIVRLKSDLAMARAAAPATAAGSGSDRERELAAAVEEMKEVDAQRKAAMDDLFKQLAAQKRAIVSRDADIDAGREALAQANAAIAERDQTLAGKETLIAEREAALKSRQAAVDLIQEKLDEVQKTMSVKTGEISERNAEIAALRQENEQVKLVDDQRRKTLDETLATLAVAEQRVRALSDDLDLTREALSATEKNLAEKSALLTSSTAALESEVTKMERDVAAATGERDAAMTLAEERRTALADRDRQITDLDTQVSRLSAVDVQRRKAMDKILLDTADLEQEKTKLELEVQRLKTTVAVQPDKAGAESLNAELIQLRNENSDLRQKVATLEMTINRQVDGPVAEVSVQPAGDDGVAALDQLEKSGWMQEKQQLESRLAQLQEAASQDSSKIVSLTDALNLAQQSALELTDRVKSLENRQSDVRESDLYKELEQINVMMREKLVEVEAERQRLAREAATTEKQVTELTRATEEQTRAFNESQTALTEALAREPEYKELIERLNPQVTELEQQVIGLMQEKKDLTTRLDERNLDLQTLKEELDRREHRLAKAERVAEVLEKARTEVMQAGDREKLNMHYNMAAVYAREGKFADAENEYLQALRIDPTDADVHYNLGILYDDEMKEPEKATVHYRRYLQLNPHGPDADRVRTWLMKLEMNTQR